MRGIPRAVVLSKTGHHALLQLLDPFNLSLKTVADIDGKPGIFGVEDVPFGAALEGVSMGFDKVFEPGDSGIEFHNFGGMVVFSLLDGSKQRLSDALQSVGVEVGTAGQDVGRQSGGDGIIRDSVSGWDRDR